MPRFLAAMLCGTLIVTYPKMLDIALGHMEKLEMPWIAYGVLPGTTVLFCGLIAWYMWLGYKSKPSGLEDFLRNLRKDKNEDIAVPEQPPEQLLEQPPEQQPRPGN